MVKINKKGALALIIAAVMVICLAPVTSLAAEVAITSFNISDDADPVVSISGSIDEPGDVTLLAIKTAIAIEEDGGVPADLSEDNIMYIDQKEANIDGSFSWEFHLRETDVEGTHITVFVGGTDVEDVAFEAGTLMGGGPSDADFGADTYYVDEQPEITFTDDAEWRAAITEITINGGSNVIIDCDIQPGVIVLPLQSVGTINQVVIKATGYRDLTIERSVDIIKYPVGTASIDTENGYAPALGCFVEGTAYDAVVNLSDSDPLRWLDDVIISVVDADGNDAGSVDKSTGLITITGGAPITKTKYTLKFEADEKYETVADIDFYIISKVGAALSTVGSVTPEVDEDKYTITVPADYQDTLTELDVTYSATVDGTPVDISTDRTFEVERPDDDGDDNTVLKKIVVITATVEDETKEQTIEVIEKGSAVFVITADNVTLTGNNVYGITGAKLVTVKVATSIVNPTVQGLKIGDDELYYSPQRSNSELAVFVDILRSIDKEDGEDEETAVARNAVIVDSVPTPIYYGKTQNPHAAGNPGLIDAGYSLQIYNSVNLESKTDAQFIVADVGGVGTVNLLSAGYVLQVYNGVGTVEQIFPVIKK